MGKLIDDLKHVSADIQHIHDDVEHISKDLQTLAEKPVLIKTKCRAIPI